MEFDSVMIGVGNSMCEYELCLLQARKDPTYLLWYVDQMLMVARSEARVQKEKAQLEGTLT